MTVTLTRDYIGVDGAFGILSKDNIQIACTAEHAFTDSSSNIYTKIPNGTFTCVRRLSPHFGYDVFELVNVPGHDFIEIHIGNDPQVDSDGCVLLGQSRIGNMVTLSRMTFEKFMGIMSGVDSFQLVVS